MKQIHEMTDNELLEAHEMAKKGFAYYSNMQIARKVQL